GCQAKLGVQVQEVAEVSELVLVELVRRGHWVGPVEERPGDRQPVLAQDSELLANDRGVIPAPHQRTAGARPEVGAEPADRCAGMADLGKVAVHLAVSPSTSRSRRSGPQPDTSAATGTPPRQGR